MVVALQIVMILISRGDVTFLANLYAFGVIWSFVLKGMAVLVLRYTHPQEREFKVPLNFHIGKTEIPLGVALITLMLLAHRGRESVHQTRGDRFRLVFSGLLFADSSFPRKHPGANGSAASGTWSSINSIWRRRAI